MKKKNVLKIIADFFRKWLNFKLSSKQKVRKVYFGLRIRFIGLLFLFMSFVIFTLTCIMYLNQRRILEEEKNSKAGALTQILSGPAEFYLERDRATTKEEIKLKYDAIVRESGNFIRYNDDSEKIMLSDVNKRVVFSTFAGDKNKTYTQLHYINQALSQKEEKLIFTDFETKQKGKKAQSYRAISFPIFLHSGELIELMRDYKKYYEKYQSADRDKKNEIIKFLWNKYKSSLNKEFDPNSKPAKKERQEKQSKKGDIDFLFLELFSQVMDKRRSSIRDGEGWMWNEKWLLRLKTEKFDAYQNDRAKDVGEIQQKITQTLETLYKRLDESRRLGALTILFNVNKIKEDLNKDIKTAFYIALIILVLSTIISLILVSFMIKNLKNLEKWALAVSDGDLERRICIGSRDEIGRLSDIFNNMLSEMKAKYHLEKFVSQSTRSMINQQKDFSSSLVLGKTGKKNFAFIFSDVRGFTSFSEKNPPEVVIEVLNLYFEIQAKIIRARKGDIDDYVGDQIMAHFGGEKKADTAISTAAAMMTGIKEFNEERKKKGLPYFEVGIGVHGGDVVVGNIGTGFRMDFTCIGDAVNLTSRLCSAALPGEILASQTLFNQAKNKYRFENADPIEVKGKENKVKIVRILAGG